MKSVLSKVMVAIVGIASVFAASAETLYWTGAVNAKWNANPENLNWTNSLGEAVAFTPGSDVVFGDIESGNTNVVVDVIKVNNPWVGVVGTFTCNSSQNYDFTSTQGSYISEMGDIVKEGSGTLSFLTGHTFTNNIYVNEGVLHTRGVSNKEINPTKTPLGNTQVVRTIRVGENGTLSLTANSFGNWDSTPQIVIDVQGGTLMLAAKQEITVGKLILNNATLLYGEGRHSLGFFHVNGDIYFQGDTPYTLQYINGNNAGLGCHDGESITMYVEDITKDDDVDVSYQWQITDWTYPSKWKKAGAGTLEFTGSASQNTFTNDLEILEGTLKYAGSGAGHISNFNRNYAFLGGLNVDRKVILHPGTTLELNQDCPLTYPSSNPKFTLVVSNATVRNSYYITDTSVNRFAPTGSYNNLGNLELYDANLDFEFGHGYSYYAILAFAARAHFAGTKPYVFTNGTNRAISLGYGTDITEVFLKTESYPEGITYYDGKTEINVDDITKSSASDLIFDAQIIQLPNHSLPGKYIRYFSCGLKKTGPGTLEMNHNNNNYTGNTEVVEGVLRLNGIIKESPVTVRDGGFIAGTGEFQKPVTIENGGGFAVDSVNPIATNLTISDLTLPEVGTLRVQNYTGALANLRMTIPQTIANATNFGDIDFSTWRVLVDGHTAKESRVMKVSLTDDNHLKISYKPDGFSVIVR